MTARPSQIRAYRILSFLAILHSAAVLSLSFGDTVWSWLWLGLATSLFLWLLVLAIHPGRSILRFLIPAIIAAALFVPCAPIYGVLIRYSIERERLIRERRIYRDKFNAAKDLRPQWLAANNLEKLLRSNARIILYSIDADSTKPPVVRKGYRQISADEIILPDDMLTSPTFARMDEVTNPLFGKVGETVNSSADETARSKYGKGWLIQRKTTNGSNEAQIEEDGWELEPYKAPAVWGHAEITDRAEQRTLITALASSARHGWNSALCHNPRHGLHIEAGASITNLSICFECNNVYTFEKDTGPLAGVSGFAITDAPESVFNAALKRHGIPVPQKVGP